MARGFCEAEREKCERERGLRNVLRYCPGTMRWQLLI
jgi:hypothetical protein